jgi:hypothetical protein
MTNLTLTQIADLCNEKLGSIVFEVIDDRLMNIENNFEGNDLSLTIEDGEYIARTTGDTTYYGTSDGYVVVSDLVQFYLIWTA